MKRGLCFILCVSLLTAGCGESVPAPGTENSASALENKEPSAPELADSISADAAETGGHITGFVDSAMIAGGTPVFYRQEIYGPWERGTLAKLPEGGDMGFDLRSRDVSGFDLSGEEERLNDVTFDTITKWPDKLPAGFSPEKLLETGKNPGLGVRGLHEKGITGKGVSIAIIDQALMLDHEEYKDNLMTYELLHCSDDSVQMHGPAVASLAVGKTCGVAPDARLYYIAATFGTFDESGFHEDLTSMAQGIRRVLEINTLLPEDEKIRVISISKGVGLANGSKETLEAIEEAKRQGVFVIITNMEASYTFSIMGLGRAFGASPDDPEVYIPGMFWADDYYASPYSLERTLGIPMDARTTASFTGNTDYAFGASGGMSWSVPWLAGMYALCLQAEPDLTPEAFIDLAFETGTPRTLEHEGKTYDFGIIINPQGLIDALEKPSVA